MKQKVRVGNSQVRTLLLLWHLAARILEVQVNQVRVRVSGGNAAQCAGSTVRCMVPVLPARLRGG